MADEEVKKEVNGEQAPAVAAAAWDGKLKLRKDVPSGDGKEIKELIFREPTGGDLERIGNPIQLSIFEATPKPVYDTAVMTAMMAHLAAVPPSTIRAMHPVDWQNGAMKLFRFFVPDQWM